MNGALTRALDLAIGVTGSLLTAPVVAVLALLIRIELLPPGRTIVDANTYNQLFTHHGIIMVWMFMIPSIPNVFGNFLVPILIGAKDVAFPKLNLASFYVYVAGAGITFLVGAGVQYFGTLGTPVALTSIAFLIGLLLLPFGEETTGHVLPN